MTIMITKTKLAIGILAMALIGTTAALAVDDNPFTDVPDSEGTEARFFSEPVEWLWDNGLTTGTSATTFSPDDNVTRGQYAAFNFRYDQNIVQPAIADIDTRLDTAESSLDALPRMYFLEVNGFGTVTRNSAGASVESNSSPGLFETDWPVDIDECVWQASITQKQALNTDTVFTDDGEVSLRSDFDIVGLASVLDPDGLTVETRSSSGTLVNRPFSVLVTCGLPNQLFVIAGAED